jgi:hypothetical protein
MKSRAKNLQLAGIELVLPTVLRIDGRQSKGARTTLTVGYATGYVDTIIAPLIGEWLLRHFHRRFTEHGRGAEGDLAAEAFYDMLACHFGRDRPFLAAIVSSHDAVAWRLAPRLGTHLGSDEVTDPAAAKPHNGGPRHGNGDMLARFMSGAGLMRWTFNGAVRAFINPRTGAAQVAFEPLPGGVELARADPIELPGARPGKRSTEAIAWYGFGVPISDPAEIVLMLRKKIGSSRHAHGHARRAAHA